MLHRSQEWWYTPVIPALALRRLRQEDYKFEVSLGYIATSYHQKKKKEDEKKIAQEHCHLL
jgi:hypothetical protein